MIPFFVPHCDHARLMVNRRALYLLQQGGRLSDAYFYTGKDYNDDDVCASYLAKAHYLLSGSKDYRMLKCAYVTLGCQCEYLYCVVRCGKCPCCRSVRQLDMVNRCVMESQLSDTPCIFFTLTYDEQHLPRPGVLDRFRCSARGPGVLCSRDVQLFFKRLRRNWDKAGIKHNIRYLVAGEYGSKRGRPHYHILMWQNPYGASDFKPYAMKQLMKDVFNAWSMCSWDVFSDKKNFGEAGDGAAAYCAKYMLKQSVYKLSHQLSSRPQPFVHTSIRNGGIGRPFIASRLPYYQANPVVSSFDFVSKDGRFHSLVIGSYLKSVLHPSVTRQIPARVRDTYRQYVDTLEKLVALDRLPYSVAADMSRLVRPAHYPQLLSRHIRVDAYRDPGLDDFRLYRISPDGRVDFAPPSALSWRDWLASRIGDASEYLLSRLVSYGYSESDIDVSSYYDYLSHQREVLRTDGCASAEMRIRERLADQMCKETF